MNLIDYILNLFRTNDVAEVQRFVANPVQAASTATGQAVTAAQLQTAYTAVAPVSAAYGGGDPIVGMQRAVANHHNLEFEPNRVLSPDTEFASRNDVLSHNRTDTDFLSNNDPQIASPHAGENVQQGGVNLDFSDMTFGDRISADDGAVVNTGTAGDIDNTTVQGDGNVVGDDNENVNTGDVETGDNSNVNIGEDNEIDDSGDVVSDGDAIVGNEGPVLNDVDTSGGSGGGAVGGDGGGGLIGIGNDGGNATGGAGGAGGGIVIVDDADTSVGGNQTNTDVGGDVVGSNVDASADEDNDVTTTTVNDNDVTTNIDDHSTTVDTDVSTNVDAGLF
ncbi:hypothetical protein [Mycobacterium hubeiense]|uniref:hypothetical protein n=1 Tax=Mycobacterium hubeiense TaxID=1867256 RepID=UPI0018EB7D4B|nr:hypothetical protein [Mycobacterium sp. QGD 101]